MEPEEMRSRESQLKPEETRWKENQSEPEEMCSKDVLWKEKHPCVTSILEIPEIVAGEDERYGEVLASCISLKALFEREEMDAHHVDCLILYQIALKVLHIMEELKQRKICPGLYDLADFYAAPDEGYRIYLLHPERFQLPGFEQDYEWYPEDERIFAGITFFDMAAQKKADCRLLYKILVASCRGNVRVPPRDIRADYSSLFYKTLSPELKEVFLQEEGTDHDHLKALLTEAVELEKASARKVREKRNEQALASAGMEYQGIISEETASGETPTEEGTIYTMFVLLRTETAHSGKISRLLYEEQDHLELETGLSRSLSLQAFVYGDGFVQARDFRQYPEGFRIQLAQSIRDYSSAETMIIACELMEKTIGQYAPGCISAEITANPEETRREFQSSHEECTGNISFRICLITDGRLKNDRMFGLALERLGHLKELGAALRFIKDPVSQCEACGRLEKLCGE